MLWPSPRRVRVRVWVECAAGQAKSDDPARVTVNLDDPRTGVSIATKTLAASSLDDAASVVAGDVAQHIFAEDPTAPRWCTGAADGRDLAAILLARQVRVYPESVPEVCSARSRKIRILKNVAHSNLCAGVARYELAHLYDLEGKHAEALLLHAKNREQYPRFYRGGRIGRLAFAWPAARSRALGVSGQEKSGCRGWQLGHRGRPGQFAVQAVQRGSPGQFAVQAVHGGNPGQSAVQAVREVRAAGGQAAAHPPLARAGSHPVLAGRVQPGLCLRRDRAGP